MANSLLPHRYSTGSKEIYDKINPLLKQMHGKRFGIGIGLLCDNVVKTAVLNDLDAHIYHFGIYSRSRS
ncbi:hypothetical protein ACPUYX_09845 [Desulfosporosinus sp. SYSU MS00001]|uniref:hypothetical protein n=1 Tax=Desulfosporosinus sp. SYSU MS00001 TaxID=3416284 RepID=UPI003CE6769D